MWLPSRHRIFSLVVTFFLGLMVVAAGQVRAQEQEEAKTKAGKKAAPTVEQMSRALEVARLSADNGMHNLSLRAVRRALESGDAGNAKSGLSIFTNPLKIFQPAGSANPPEDPSQRDQRIEQQLRTLSQSWSAHDAPAKDVYETLVAVVLPESDAKRIRWRPSSLGMDPSNVNAEQTSARQALSPRSVGAILVEWARRADAESDLQAKLEARVANATDKLAGHVMLGQIALATDDAERANQHLAALGEIVANDKQPKTAELVCHLAIPALQNAAVSRAALPLVEAHCQHGIAARLARNGILEPHASLLLMAARASFKVDDAKAGIRLLNSYLDFHKPNNDRYSGDYGIQLSKRQMETVAAELISAQQLGEALRILEMRGELKVSRRSSGVGSPRFALDLARHLQSLPADERYELLYNATMPTGSRPGLFAITVFIPDQRPPAIFLPEGKPLSIPGYGALRDVFSTGEMLVETAEEVDKLSDLTGELDQLAQKKVDGAKELLILAKIRQGGGEAALLDVANLADQMAANLPKQGDYSKQLSTENYLIACQCLNEPALVLHAERMLKNLVQHSKRVQDGFVRPYLRRALALATIKTKQGDSKLLAPADFKDWQAVSHPHAASRYAGPVSPLWIEHEGHIHNIANDEESLLYFRYPLTGTFEISVDSTDDGWAEGELSFGGLYYEFGGYLPRGYVWGMGRHGIVRQPCSYLRRGEFNRESMDVGPEGATFRINGVPVYQDKGSTAGSPWFALYNYGERNPVYRNVRLTGNPTIPREVHLIDDSAMRGWSSRYYAESQPEPIVAATSRRISTGLYDWTVSEGVLEGRLGEMMPSGPESLIYYGRPLFDGETISYEFFHVPGRYEVHPTVGRLAFLLREDHVGLHWLTRSAMEWTAITADNEVVVAEDQQHDGSLPLKANDWNSLTISLSKNHVVLQLNGTKIYRRKLRDDDHRLFGLFHFKNQSAVKVRNVVLKGDWPEKLSDTQLANLSAVRNSVTNAVDGAALNAVIEERRFVSNAYEVYKDSLGLSPTARYRMLAKWVLPNPNHPEFRLQAAATPTHPAPPAADDHPIDVARSAAAVLSNEARRIEVGGNLVAPVLELVATMREFDRLDDLESFVQRIEPATEAAALDQLSLLALLSIARRDFEQANDRLSTLYPRLAAVGGLATHQRWGFVLAAGHAIRHEETRTAAIRILNFLIERVIQAGRGRDAVWVQHVRQLRWQAEELEQRRADFSSLFVPPKIEHWDPVTHPRAWSRGRGHPTARWSVFNNGAIMHTPGHESDYVYFNTPLQGDFTIECDLSGFGWRETYMGYAGTWIGLDNGRDNFIISRMERNRATGTIDPPVENVGSWYRYRIEVKGDVYRCYVNDTKIHEEQIGAQRDPWIMVYCYRHCSNAGFQNFRITGTPTIPESIHLTAHADLTGWLPFSYDQSSDAPDADWRKQGAAIVGKKVTDRPGHKRESVLYYHRPLLEDGEITYEFYYQPGESLASPCLDRLALLLTPTGVKGHWLSNERYDRTGTRPDNVFEEPKNRRGPAELPLKADDWNAVKLRLTGDKLILTLNDQEIYERDLERTNQRLFGVFHYADETTAQVRNVVYRGEWPRQLPEFSEIGATPNPALTLNTQRDELADKFEHDFRTQGFPDEVFFVQGEADRVTPTDEGLRMELAGLDKWNNLIVRARIRIEGDFDVTATFDDFKIQTPALGRAAGSYLHVLFENEQRDDVGLLRRIFNKGASTLEVATSFVPVKGERRKYLSRSHPSVALAGTMRLARRGKTVYFLFAETDSDKFNLLDQWHVNDAPSLQDGFRLMLQTGAEGEDSSVVWKKISVRADKILKGF